MLLKQQRRHTAAARRLAVDSVQRDAIPGAAAAAVAQDVQIVPEAVRAAIAAGTAAPVTVQDPVPVVVKAAPILVPAAVKAAPILVPAAVKALAMAVMAVVLVEVLAKQAVLITAKATVEVLARQVVLATVPVLAMAVMAALEALHQAINAVAPAVPVLAPAIVVPALHAAVLIHKI